MAGSVGGAAQRHHGAGGASTHRAFGVIPYTRGDSTADFAVLLVKQRQKHGGFWGFPKGYGKQGEGPLATALREFEEETGISHTEVRLRQDLPTFDAVYECEKRGRTVTKKVVHYAGILERAVPPVVPKAEILDGRWVSFAEGLQLLEHDENKELLRSCHRELLKRPTTAAAPNAVEQPKAE